MISKSSALLTFLIISPIIINKIGIENYGKVNVALGIVSIIDSIVEYTFNITSVSEIAKATSSRKINVIYTKTYSSKLYLILIGIFIYFIFFIFSSNIKEEKILYILSFFFVIGKMMNPIWFFLGIQKMYFITILNIVSKLILILSVIIFIIEKSDYIFINFLIGMSELIPSLILIIYIYFRFDMKFKVYSIKKSLLYMKGSFIYFLGLLMFRIINFAPIVFMGYFSSYYLTGIYSIFDKIISNIKEIRGILFNSSLSFFTKLYYQTGKANFYKFLYKFSFLILASFLILVAIFIVFKFNIISYFMEYNMKFDLTYYILLISTLVSFLWFPQSIIIVIKRIDKVMTLSILFSSLILISLLPLLIGLYNILGTSVSVLISEIVMVLFITFLLKKYDNKEN